MPQIADAIRVAVLAKHGGVWLDVDTVILDRSAKKYFEIDAEHSVVFFGTPSTGSCRICFINSVANSNCMNQWLEFIQKRIDDLTPKTFIDWDHLGNSFIDPYAKNHLDEVKIIPSESTMPELSAFGLETYAASNLRTRAYLEYYFLQQRHIEDVPDEILLLHNSWTPRDFINMDRENFLRCNFTIANVLMAALDMKRNHNAPPITFKSD